MGFVGGARNIVGYAKAELSRVVQGDLPPERVALRLAQCMDCPARVPSERVGYCSACRCPHWRRSELAVKATMPAATCPRGRWDAILAK